MIIDLVSHTTYVVCVNFIREWRDLQFKVDTERQIFGETFLGNFIYFSEFFARNLLRGNRLRNIIRILFWCLTILIEKFIYLFDLRQMDLISYFIHRCCYLYVGSMKINIKNVRWQPCHSETGYCKLLLRWN